MAQPVGPNHVVLNRWLDRVDAQNILRSRSRFETVSGGLVDDRDRGFLTLGPPKNSFRQTANVAGFAFWFPDGLPMGTSILMTGSRIGLQPETKSGIFDAIRTVACRFDAHQHFLITHSGLATDKYVARAAELFDLPVLFFRPLPADIHSDWFRGILNSREENRACYYGNVSGGDADIDPDRLLVSLATEVRVLSVRPGGRILDAISSRLATEKSAGPAKTMLLMNNALTSSKLASQLIDRGVVPWWLYQDVPEGRQRKRPWSQPIMQIQEFASRNQLTDYLIHWTRRRTGPWPDQTVNQFLDDLILGLPASDHSRIAALIRILATKKLLANNQLTRDSTPVVCFSESTADELLSRRRFRSHLSRWDFETVGIAIKRDVLAGRGGQPVIYGDNAIWKQLPAAKRPFFQQSRSKTVAGVLDWTVEREWRVIGSVDLSPIPASDAYVYVETAEEAESVAPFSRWPVIVLANSFAN